jgi:hypothetical protein
VRAIVLKTWGNRVIVLAGLVTICAAGASPVDAAVHGQAVRSAATRIVALQVDSTFAKPGSVQVQDVGGTVLATCKGKKSPGSVTCIVHVPYAKSVVFVAKPNVAGEFKKWTAACGSAPGPVCALRVTSNVHVVSNFGAPTHAPYAVPTLNAVDGDTTGCTGTSDSQKVFGAALPGSASVTLKDDGHLVASGTTTVSGKATLSYTATSEPGIYRKLVMKALGKSATTDVYNVGSVCSYWNGIGTGTVSFKVVGSDFDATSKVGVTFGSHSAVGAATDASGAFTVTTPNYACTAGATKNLLISAKRGVGSKFARPFTYTFVVTC